MNDIISDMSFPDILSVFTVTLPVVDFLSPPSPVKAASPIAPSPLSSPNRLSYRPTFHI